MGKVTGFLEVHRQKPPMRPVPNRIRDWREVYLPYEESALRAQTARCMDCGIPFCHQGCPLGNLIPDWNDLVYHQRWQTAIERLHATNNFPEWTGRLCPAPCEGSCVLGINDDPVAIKHVELAIIERAFDEGWVQARPPASRTGKRVAVVGSGPAGLAAADQLNRAGHQVTVFERADRIGGLLRYGIPEFKLEKRFLDRRLALLAEEGIEFRAGVEIGIDLPVTGLRRQFDAIVLCCGAAWARDLQIPGRELGGVHFAVEYLTQQSSLAGDDVPDAISAAGKRGHLAAATPRIAGTVHRQGARSVLQFELWRGRRTFATTTIRGAAAGSSGRPVAKEGGERLAVSPNFLGHDGQVGPARHRGAARERISDVARVRANATWTSTSCSCVGSSG